MTSQNARESLIRANEKEYRFTHCFEPMEGSWDVPAEGPKHLTVLGRMDWIEYTTKKCFEGRETFIFHHDHEIDHRPWLARGRYPDGREAWAILGGGYTITAHGIEDDEDDPREIPLRRTFDVSLDLPARVTGMGRMHAIKAGGREYSFKGKNQILAYVRKPRARLWIVPGPTRGAR